MQPLGSPPDSPRNRGGFPLRIEHASTAPSSAAEWWGWVRSSSGPPWTRNSTHRRGSSGVAHALGVRANRPHHGEVRPLSSRARGPSRRACRATARAGGGVRCSVDVRRPRPARGGSVERGRRYCFDAAGRTSPGPRPRRRARGGGSRHARHAPRGPCPSSEGPRIGWGSVVGNPPLLCPSNAPSGEDERLGNLLMGSTALAMRYSLNAGALDDRTRHGYHERDAEGEGRNPHEPVRDKRRRMAKARSGEQELAMLRLRVRSPSAPLAGLGRSTWLIPSNFPLVPARDQPIVVNWCLGGVR